MESGNRASLDVLCYHQIIFCRANLKLSPPPPPPPLYDRKVWHYDRANVVLLGNLNWENLFNQDPDPNWQVQIFTKTLLNIISNFVPNKIVRIIPKDPPWVTNHLKSMLKKQNRLYKNYKRHDYKTDDKIRVDLCNKECKNAVEFAKQSYLRNMCSKLNDPNVSKKSYWKILNKFMNRCKALKIPAILVNHSFVTDCKMKYNIFAKYFSEQCKLIASVLYLMDAPQALV